MGTGKHLEQLAASEIERAARNVANEIENQNTDPQTEIEMQLHEVEHIAKETLKVAEVVASGWNKGSAERTKEWTIDL